MANKVSEMFEGLTNNFKGMIDANSVVGEPIIVNDGTMIVPISKVHALGRHAVRRGHGAGRGHAGVYRGR